MRAFMISLSEARAELLAVCPVLEPVELPLGEALGCAVSDDVVSAHAVPPFVNSAVDGYAVRAADVAAASSESPATLDVLGSVRAGTVADRPVRTGTCWKVMTGAPLPEGADAVVMVEDTSAAAERGVAATAGSTVEIRRAATAGDGVRPAGSDVRPGEVLVPRGTALRAAHLGVLASAGVRTVRVFPRPRVAVFATGDELVTEDRPLRPGEIYESNTAMITALLREANCVPARVGNAGDDPDALAATLTAVARECDAIVTSGGVSMGDADPVKAALARLGRLHALQVAIRPAKPFAYAVLDGPTRPVPLFGLPGNPVSSLISFELLARPALRAMSGHPSRYRPPVRAISDVPLTARGGGRTDFLRAVATFAADGRLHVTPVAAQGSHQLAQTARADALVELAPGTSVEAGGEVTAHPLRWD
jgi:molybdenum cofactor synthesis domain-containing protein